MRTRAFVVGDGAEDVQEIAAFADLSARLEALEWVLGEKGDIIPKLGAKLIPSPSSAEERAERRPK